MDKWDPERELQFDSGDTDGRAEIFFSEKSDNLIQTWHPSLCFIPAPDARGESRLFLAICGFDELLALHRVGIFMVFLCFH